MIPKLQITVDIKEPCSEDWGAMQPVHGGRHCLSCAKNVVDFTGMSQQQVAKYLVENTGKICGRVPKELLNVPLQIEEEKQGGRMYAWLLRAAVLAGLTLPLTASANDIKTEIASPEKADVVGEPGPLQITIAGTVKDIETGEPIANATVLINAKDSVVTDGKGEFKKTVTVTEGPQTLFRLEASAGFYSGDTASFAIPSNAKIVAEFNLNKKEMPHNTIYGVIAGREYGSDCNDTKWNSRGAYLEVEGYPGLIAVPNAKGNYVLQLPDSLIGCKIQLVYKYGTAQVKETRNLQVAGVAQQLDFIDYYEKLPWHMRDGALGGAMVVTTSIYYGKYVSLGGIFGMGYYKSSDSGFTLCIGVPFVKRSIPIFKSKWFKKRDSY